MRTILLFTALVFLATAGRAQQANPGPVSAIPQEGTATAKRHTFTIKRERILSGAVCGGSGVRDSVSPRFTETPVRMKQVYVSLYAPHDFRKAALGRKEDTDTFTGKVNDTLLRFYQNVGQDTAALWFMGEYKENGKTKTMRVRLSRCEMMRDAEGNEVFYVCRECVEPEPEKKKGFLAWLGRIF